MTGAAPAPDEAAPDPGQLPRLLVLAVGVGLIATLGAVGFTWIEHHLQHLLWNDLPETFGWAEPTAWWVVLILLAGAVFTWAACTLPGNGGHLPIDGLSFDLPASLLPTILLACLASLSFGAVLGPEAPLMAIGSAVGYLAMRSASGSTRQILMIAGAMAGIGTIFGNPMVTSVLVLEAAALTGLAGKNPMMLLAPTLVALGSGYLLAVGVNSWSGFAETTLSIPNLPAYPDVQAWDLALAVPLAVGIGIGIEIALRLGKRVREAASANRLPALVIAALVIAAAALATRGITGQPVEMVLFSGQAAIPAALGITSVGTLIVIAIAKIIAYSASLTSGFRGGQIFPAVYLGCVLAIAIELLVPGSTQAGLVAAGVAAATAALLRLPFTATLLATLLCASAGLAVTAPAIVGAVFGLLTRIAIDQRAKAPITSPESHVAAGTA